MSSEQRALLIHAFKIGPVFLALGALAPVIGLVYHWSFLEGQQGGGFWFVILLISLVPMVSLIAAALGLVIFPLSHTIVGLLSVNPVLWPLAHAMLGAVLSAFCTLPFAAWVAGGTIKALQGHGNTGLVFALAAVAGLISGVFFGLAMKRYAAGNVRHMMG
jgi:hypothetical protein